MQVAHIIMAHKAPSQVERLVSRLLYPGFSVFIHIDKRTDIRPFMEAIKHPNVRFIKNRVKVNWGGFSQVQAFINSMAECMHHLPDMGYINFLSGQDYPLRSMSEFDRFLSGCPGSAFMEYVTGGDGWLEESRRRIAQYHIVDSTFPGQFKVEKLINSIMPARRLPEGFELVGRSQWFTVSRECVLHLLDVINNRKDIVNCFKYSWGADELFFQTILYNSHLKHQLVNDNLRYIDWSANQSSPKVLATDDADVLVHSGKFFARKFDPDVDHQIMDYIDTCLLT